MSKAAISIFVFGLYLALTGVTLVVAPNLLLGTLRLPPTNEPWVRVLGVVAFVLAFYYIQAARQEVTSFFRWTTVARTFVLLAFIGLWAAGVAPAAVIIFGAIDTAGAIWTALALRQ